MIERSDEKPATEPGLELHPEHGQAGPSVGPPLNLPPELVGKSEEEVWEWVYRTGRNPLPVRALQIETSSICNFRCESCPLSLPDYDRPQKHLCRVEFEKVLDAFPEVEKVELQGLGEVFLNPDLKELVAAATARGVEVHTYSNASRVTPEAAFAVVEAGLSLINFSMDGADDETFRTLRRGGQLGVYKRCVKHLLDARRALGVERPRIGVMTVLSKRNLHQLPQLLAIAEELGVDAITLTKLLRRPARSPLGFRAVDQGAAHELLLAATHGLRDGRRTRHAVLQLRRQPRTQPRLDPRAERRRDLERRGLPRVPQAPVRRRPAGQVQDLLSVPLRPLSSW
ncbi:MAG: radical SAM protein [Planctomycetota bacterium]